MIHRKRKRVEYFRRKNQPLRYAPGNSQSCVFSAEEADMLIQSTQTLLNTQSDSLIDLWKLYRDDDALEVLNRLTRILLNQIQDLI